MSEKTGKQKAKPSFRLQETPKAGSFVEAGPGIRWTRMSLPFRLDHVNIYLIEDDNGWAVVDTGTGDDVSYSI